MRESGPGFNQRGILLVLRAAAVLVIATGVNDVIAGALPTYQPLYVYLGAVALIAWLDGVLIGIVAAVTATAAYALLFLPRSVAMSPRVLAPLSATVGVALVFGVLRALIRRRRREPPQFTSVVATPLLAAPAAPAPDMTEVLDAIDGLREELRSAVTRDDADELERVRARERTLARDHADAEARLIRSSREVESMHADLLDRAARIRELETTLENERAGARGTAARVGELQTERQELRRALETARTNAAALTARVERLEREVQAAHQDTAAREDLRHELDLARLEATAQSARLMQSTARTKVFEGDSAELRRELASARAEAQRNEERLRAMEEDLRAARAQWEAKVADAEAQARNTMADAEGRVAVAEVRVAAAEARGLDAEARATTAGARAADAESNAAALAARIAELDADSLAQNERIAELQSAVDAASADVAMQMTRVAKLEHSHARVGILETEKKELQHELEAALDAERNFDERLQTIVNHLAADHETDLGKAVEEREAARAETRSLTTRMTSMQHMMEEMRGAAQKEIDRLRRRIDDLERGAAQPAERRTRVLVAYPDPDMRAAARASLERAGYEIFSAADGLEALRTAIANRPDVVIADAAMPKMDGRELCQMLKSQEKTAAIRVVLLARAGETLPRGEHPADEILHKPVPLDALKNALAQLVPGTRP